MKSATTRGDRHDQARRRTGGEPSASSVQCRRVIHKIGGERLNAAALLHGCKRSRVKRLVRIVTSRQFLDVSAKWWCDWNNHRAARLATDETNLVTIEVNILPS